MAGYNLPDNVSYHDPRAPWNATEEDEIYTILEDSLNATRSLFDILSELRDIDPNWFSWQFKPARQHENILAFLDEIVSALVDALEGGGPQ